MKPGLNFGKIAIFHSQTIIFFQPKYIQLEMGFYRPEKFPERKLIQRIRLKFVYRCFIFYPFPGDLFRELCQLPSFTDLGTDAFKNCGSLEILMLYYHDEAFRIADSAFAGVDADGLVILTDDIVTQTALEQRGFTVVSAYDSSMLAGNCGISGCTCSSCSWSYNYAPKDASTHYIWEVCNNCSANEYAYRHTGSHSFNSSGVCTLCGYAQAQSCSHSSTQRIWSGCDWEDVCRNCGETVNWGTTHGSYSYGSWTYYTASQHRRYGTCNDCGSGGKYQYGSHSTTSH